MDFEVPIGTEELETLLGSLVPKITASLRESTGHHPTPRVTRACLVYIFKFLSYDGVGPHTNMAKVASEYGCSPDGMRFRYRSVYAALRTISPFQSLPEQLYIQRWPAKF